MDSRPTPAAAAAASIETADFNGSAEPLKSELRRARCSMLDEELPEPVTDASTVRPGGPDDGPPEVDASRWWLAWDGDTPVAFGGARKLARENVILLERCGVVPSHRGRGLQLRLIRAPSAGPRTSRLRLLALRLGTHLALHVLHDRPHHTRIALCAPEHLALLFVWKLRDIGRCGERDAARPAPRRRLAEDARGRARARARTCTSARQQAGRRRLAASAAVLTASALRSTVATTSGAPFVRTARARWTVPCPTLISAAACSIDLCPIG